MKVKIKSPPTPDLPAGAKTTPQGVLPEGLPNRFFNADGELDLRGVTGADAFRFFQAQGKTLPISTAMVGG